ncbi:MAG TPA: metal-dependent hydrolase [Solirubrobacteraceae bacterium]|jgi:L-ascorbate metabolism protein UlaG (beta-lactamase superfamily)|nr:metal-dependent hydrolase [Solirubrobacteraceae bacterium]
MEIHYLGHAAFELSDGATTILIDPFITGNPSATVAAADLSPDVILLTHGHGDHYGDVVPIAKRTGATVVAIVEIAEELRGEGLEDVRDPNIGGTVKFDWGSVKLVPAWHTSTTPKGTVSTPSGLIIEFGGKTVYHLGDTALFGDLELIGARHAIDVALVPIGGYYTMDREDAVEAVRMLGAAQVIPCHYNTFPPIETDAEAFKADVESSTASDVIVLGPGERHSA